MWARDDGNWKASHLCITNQSVMRRHYTYLHPPRPVGTQDWNASIGGICSNRNRVCYHHDQWPCTCELHRQCRKGHLTEIRGTRAFVCPAPISRFRWSGGCKTKSRNAIAWRCRERGRRRICSDNRVGDLENNMTHVMGSAKTFRADQMGFIALCISEVGWRFSRKQWIPLAVVQRPRTSYGFETRSAVGITPLPNKN